MKRPQRASPFQPRAVQVADYIRQQVHTGQWDERLPAERLMAAQIGVSRDTVRAALKLLKEQGAVTERSHEGTSLRKLPRSTPAEPFTVGLLIPIKMEWISYRTLSWINELRRLLYQKRAPLEIYDGYFHKPRFFRSIMPHAHHDCWVSVFPTQAALRWSLRQREPSVVIGTIDQSIGLRSVDIHYRALCHHAAGRMIAHGHQQLALILPRREWGADKESIAGFLEGAAGHSHVTTSVYYHDATPASLCAMADRLLAMKQRPTAWIVAVSPHFLTVMMHLLRRGVAIPGEISLISQDSEPQQHFASPEPTRYTADIPQLARVTAREIFRAMSGRSDPITPRQIVPELVPGQTLGPAPKSS